MNLAVTAAVALLQAANPNQFNLVCEGTWDIGSGREAYNSRWKVDLDRGVWCFNTQNEDGSDSCTQAKTIHAVLPAELKLTDTMSINRSTGELTIPRYSVVAQCRREAFTGIPENRF